MYAMLWRILPGPVWLRLFLLLLLMVFVLAALVTWVFPWVDALISSQDVVSVRQ